MGRGIAVPNVVGRSDPVSPYWHDITSSAAATTDEGGVFPLVASTGAMAAGGGQGFYVGHGAKFSGVRFHVYTKGVGTWKLVWEYSTGASTWSELTTVIDGTEDFKGDLHVPIVTFTPPVDWVVQPANSLYWIRAKVEKTATCTVVPELSYVRLESDDDAIPTPNPVQIVSPTTGGATKVLSFGVHSTASNNKINVSNFENTTGDWNTPAGWAASTDWSAKGDYSLAFTRASPSGSGAEAYSADITVSAATQYTFSCYLKNEFASTTVRINIAWWDGTGVHLDEDSCMQEDYAAGYDDRLTHTFTTPAGTYKVAIRLLVLAGEAGVAYFDALQLETGGTASAYQDDYFGDFTTPANNATVGDVTILPRFDEAVSPYQSVRLASAFYVGNTTRFDEIAVNVSTIFSGYTAHPRLCIKWQYWNGHAWTDMTGVSDGTDAFTVSGTSDVTWNPPSDWAGLVLPAAGEDTAKYWIRAYVFTPIIRVSGTLVVPLATQVWISQWPYQLTDAQQNTLRAKSQATKLYAIIGNAYAFQCTGGPLMDGNEPANVAMPIGGGGRLNDMYKGRSVPIIKCDRVGVVGTAMSFDASESYRRYGLLAVNDMGDDDDALNPGNPSDASGYNWTFGDSGTASNTKTTTHTYASPGTYLVTCTLPGIKTLAKRYVTVFADWDTLTGVQDVISLGAVDGSIGSGGFKADVQIAGNLTTIAPNAAVTVFSRDFWQTGDRTGVGTGWNEEQVFPSSSSEDPRVVMYGYVVAGSVKRGAQGHVRSFQVQSPEVFFNSMMRNITFWEESWEWVNGWEARAYKTDDSGHDVWNMPTWVPYDPPSSYDPPLPELGNSGWKFWGWRWTGSEGATGVVIPGGAGPKMSGHGPYIKLGEYNTDGDWPNHPYNRTDRLFNMHGNAIAQWTHDSDDFKGKDPRGLRTWPDIADVILHLLIEHTNYTTWHNVYVPYNTDDCNISTRHTSLSVNEGTLIQNLRDLAANFFGMTWSDRYGNLHCKPNMQLLPKWYGEPTPVMDFNAENILELQIDENMLPPVALVQVNVTTDGGEAYEGTFPAGSSDGYGSWEIVHGVIHDDRSLMQTVAEAIFNWRNNGISLRLTTGLNHALNLNDVVTLTCNYTDDGGYSYNFNRDYFLITGLTMEYDSKTGAARTSITCEKLIPFIKDR